MKRVIEISNCKECPNYEMVPSNFFHVFVCNRHGWSTGAIGHKSNTAVKTSPDEAEAMLKDWFKNHCTLKESS